MTKKVLKGFNAHPYPYHHEVNLIETLTNLGFGIARDNGWVIQVPFVLPGELIQQEFIGITKLFGCRFYRNSSVFTRSG